MHGKIPIQKIKKEKFKPFLEGKNLKSNFKMNIISIVNCHRNKVVKIRGTYDFISYFFN